MLFGRGLLNLPPLRERSDEFTSKDETDPPSKQNDIPNTRPLIHQTTAVARRSAAAIWRDPTYVTAKLILNIAAGLFIGFTFWKSPSTTQGVQNKLFSIFVVLILTVPGAQQLQIPFITNRSIYEIRERPRKMYSRSSWVTAQILVELPWNMVPGILLFFSWYWTMGYPIERAGFTFFISVVLIPFYSTTVG